MSYSSAEPPDVLRSLWWLLVLFGVVAVGVGIFLVSPHETLSTFTVIAGIFLLVDGVLLSAPPSSGAAKAAGCSPSWGCSARSRGWSS